MKKLPIGIQTFSQIRTGNYVYIDKTEIALNLIDNGKYYFLSRPRRFGKSLFLDTLNNIFQGNQALFKGLYIDDKYDWEQFYPVVHLSFASGVMESRAKLDISIKAILQNNANRFEIQFDYDEISLRFSELIRKVSEKYKQPVVILIDEYDKPILDNITNSQTAVEMREGLKNIYSVIKDCDAHLKFVFLTGVSKFSKVSIFSGLNNLEDITTDSRYATICGFTQADLEREFEDYLHACDPHEIKKWYDGYAWLGSNVYNPFDILLFFAKGNVFRNYWFETGTPSFLIKLLRENRHYIPNIERIEAGEELIGSFEIEKIKPETLLFQAGYLTIRKTEQLGAEIIHTLTYPNLEVKKAMTDYILTDLVYDIAEKNKNKISIYRALQKGDPDQFKDIFIALFASIPHDWYRKNNMADYEGYYASIFYCYFASLGLDVIPEDTTNHGKIDMTLQFEDAVYIFEFKVTELIQSEHTALGQIKAKKYYEKYSDWKNIYMIGIEFSKEERNITAYEWEKVSKPEKQSK